MSAFKQTLTDLRVHQGSGEGESTSLSLLHCAAEGEEVAWRRLGDLYAPLIAHWCLRSGVSPGDVADVSQEVFLAVSRNLATFERSGGRGSFRRWLRTIVRTKIVDWRRRKREQAEGGSDALHRLLHLAASVDDRIDDENDQEADEERTLIVRQALELIAGEFPEWYQGAFHLLAIEGADTEVVAERFSVRKNAVYTMKSRVLRRLRGVLEGLLD